MTKSAKPLASTIAGVAVALVAATGHAQAINRNLVVSATVASDYFAHGLSQTDGQPAWRIAADFQHPGGFFAGGYVANVEYGTEYSWTRPREYQVNAYGGYRMRGPRWSTQFAVARYRYPGLVIDYDYTRFSAGASYRDRYFVAVSYAPRWLGFRASSVSLDAGVVRPLAWDLELGANAGAIDVGGYGEGDYTYWDVGLSKPVGRFAVDLRYHDSSAKYVSALGSPDGSRLALSVTYAIAPRSP